MAAELVAEYFHIPIPALGHHLPLTHAQRFLGLDGDCRAPFGVTPSLTDVMLDEHIEWIPFDPETRIDVMPGEIEYLLVTAASTLGDQASGAAIRQENPSDGRAEMLGREALRDDRSPGDERPAQDVYGRGRRGTRRARQAHGSRHAKGHSRSEGFLSGSDACPRRILID